MASSNYAIKAVQLWSANDVAAWLESLSLGQLGPAFKHNGVTGPDLLDLTSDDLVGSIGCTPFQAKKIVNEVQRLGISRGPFDAPPSAPPLGYPPPATYPPPLSPPGGSQDLPRSYPSQPMPPPYGGSQPIPPPYGGSQPNIASYGSQPITYNGSQPGMAYNGGSQPVTPLGSAPLAAAFPGSSQPGTPLGGGPSLEVEKLRQELEREKLRNELRQEMNTQARLAAVEQKGNGSAPVVVQQSTTSQQQAAPPPPVYGYGYTGAMAYERYCGPISLIIGILIFPCICFCPVDERPVAVPAVVPVRTW